MTKDELIKVLQESEISGDTEIDFTYVNNESVIEQLQLTHVQKSLVVADKKFVCDIWLEPKE